MYEDDVTNVVLNEIEEHDLLKEDVKVGTKGLTISDNETKNPNVHEDKNCRCCAMKNW